MLNLKNNFYGRKFFLNFEFPPFKHHTISYVENFFNLILITM